MSAGKARPLGHRWMALLGGRVPGLLLPPSGPWGPRSPHPGQEEALPAQCIHGGEDMGVRGPMSLMRNGGQGDLRNPSQDTQSFKASEKIQPEPLDGGAPNLPTHCG